jgi:hypothetical protein
MQSAFAFAFFPITSLNQAQTMNTSTEATVVAANTNAPRDGGDDAIRPFKYRASDAELAELRRRINATRFPEREPVADDSQAFSSPRFRHSRSIGGKTTTGARSRRS